MAKVAPEQVPKDHRCCFDLNKGCLRTLRRPLAFDITYGLLRNVAHDNRPYRVGVLTVLDTNLRPLLAGIALLVDETRQTICSQYSTTLYSCRVRLQALSSATINKQSRSYQETQETNFVRELYARPMASSQEYQA